MAGLLAARALADQADRVVVLERDELPEPGRSRRGVPQGRHAHAILAAGVRCIEGWFPGFSEELLAAGALRGDGGDALWWQSGALKVRANTGIEALCASRPLIEATVRTCVQRVPNIEFRPGTKVDGLAFDGDRVRGVLVGGERLAAGLVVDATGRDTRLLGQVVDAGNPAPAVSNVTMDMAYATRVLPRRPGDLDGKMYAIIAPTPPHENRFGVLLPIEHDRWILTMGGFHGDAAPTDDAGYLAFARSLPHPAIAEVLERAEPLTEVMTHRMASSQRRHFERCARVPEGYVAVGDAICSFNPIYGQGMSSAALQARALAGAMGRDPLGSAVATRRFYKAAAKVVANPWQIAVGSDFLHPATTGPKPPGTDLINRYVAKAQLASHSSPQVLAKLQEVQNLLASPPSLMAPATMIRVLTAARRSPAFERPGPSPRSADAPVRSPFREDPNES